MLDLALSDAISPPGAKGGLRVNSARVWARLDGGPWMVTIFRSLHRARSYAALYSTDQEALTALTDTCRD